MLLHHAHLARFSSSKTPAFKNNDYLRQASGIKSLNQMGTYQLAFEDSEITYVG